MTTILMTQALQRQGEIWHNILSSQNLTVIWENLDADILAVLEGMETAGLALSQLLLLDMGMMGSAAVAIVAQVIKLPRLDSNQRPIG